MNVLYIITIFDTKTNTGYVKSTTCPETVADYDDSIMGTNQVMFVNEIDLKDTEN